MFRLHIPLLLLYGTSLFASPIDWNYLPVTKRLIHLEKKIGIQTPHMLEKWAVNFYDSPIFKASQDGYTLLHAAVDQNNFELFKWIAKKNPDLLFKVMKEYEFNPLFLALQTYSIDNLEWVDQVKWMLNLAPNLIYTTDPWGGTLLHHLCRLGQLSFIQELYAKHQWLLCKKDPYGYLPLAQALFHVQEHVVQWMIQEDPKLLYEPNKEGNYPLHQANYYEQERGPELIKWLITFDPKQLKLCDANGLYPISRAIKLNNLGAIKDMVRMDPSLIYATDESKQTPFHVAAACGDLEFLKELVELDRQQKKP